MPSYFFERRSSMKESKFQSRFIKKIKERFPNAIVMKNDPNYIQGIPDILVLYQNRWAAFECKQSKDARHRPNQDHYVDLMNTMSYSSFVYPENEEVVLGELQQAFES